ncbi:hypothetical protein Bbelb_189560 [Branchiostoma belcheri]|nr:hypothetical protein Bbelb_189560 [Branchiostoma belcheri]
MTLLTCTAPHLVYSLENKLYSPARNLTWSRSLENKVYSPEQHLTWSPSLENKVYSPVRHLTWSPRKDAGSPPHTTETEVLLKHMSSSPVFCPIAAWLFIVTRTTALPVTSSDLRLVFDPYP